MEPLNLLALERALQALEPVSEHLVVVGGTAQGLFQHHPLATPTDDTPLATEDVDLAASRDVPKRSDLDLLGNLHAAGFEDQVRGADEPTWIYCLREHPANYVQFITQLTGSGTTRKGDKDRLLHFAGLAAEKLRHVEVLLNSPWRLPLSAEGQAVIARVVNPSAYVAQKLLTLEGRSAEKRGKDLLYVFDTLTRFGRSADLLGRQEGELLGHLTKKQSKAARAAFAKHCLVVGDAIRRAARVAGDQRRPAPTEDQIRLAFERYLPRMLPGLLGSQA